MKLSTYIENYQRVLGDRGKMSGSQHAFYCPFNGCVGYGKRKFFVDPVKGFWCCKHCSKEVPGKVYRDDCKDASGGTWREFCDLMDDDFTLWPTGAIGFDPYSKIRPLTGKKRREVWSKMFEIGTLSDEHAQAIRDRGINPIQAGMISASPELLTQLQAIYDTDTLVRASLIYLQREEIYTRTCLAPGRILIPYYDKEQVFYFVGFMKCPKRQPEQAIEDYQVLKSEWKKIASPAGYTPAIYGEVYEDSPFVIITEGQLKAAAAIQQGLICIGIQGIMTGHASVVKKLVQKRVKRAIICFDTQVDDQDNVDWAAEKLARDLLRAGIPTYKAMLPLDPAVDNGKKMDLDSFLLHFGVLPLVNILVQARPCELVGEGPETDDASEDPDEGTASDGDD